MRYDQKLHFVAGMFISVVAGAYARYDGLILSLFAGVAKELYDYGDYGTFSMNDMLYTWLGGIVGFLLTEVVKWIF